MDDTKKKKGLDVAGWLQVLGALFVLMILYNALDFIQQVWQGATAIACQDDPRHEHVVCRLPNGDLQHWTHDD